MTRYAVYYAPDPTSALHRFGSAWLGRDAWTGTTVEQPRFAGISPARLAAITAAPRGYGFHATLKPPFALAPGHTADDLRAAFAAFARDGRPFELPALQLIEIGGFLALVPRERSLELDALAERAVRAFEPFRAAPPDDERARRALTARDARERELLDTWGYPYVLDRWRFHLTLTERLEPLERARVQAELAAVVEPFCRERTVVDGIALFVQPERTEPFRYRTRYAFESCRVPPGRS